MFRNEKYEDENLRTVLLIGIIICGIFIIHFYGKALESKNNAINKESNGTRTEEVRRYRI